LPRIGGGVASMINASASGTAMPPPMPCRARAAMRRAIVGLSAQNADAIVNTAKPAMNMRRRPYLSPNVDPVRMEAAKASAYALTVQLSPSIPAPSSWCRVGSAVVTTSASSPTRNEANEPRTRVQRCVVRNTSGAVLIAGMTDLPLRTSFASTVAPSTLTSRLVLEPDGHVLRVNRPRAKRGPGYGALT
jgi:hypothetical protein